MSTCMRSGNLAVYVAVVVGGICTPIRASDPSKDNGIDQPFAEQWVHASETSAVVYWQTGGQARDAETAGTGHVEYGPTEAYGKRTAEFSLPPVCDEVPAGVRVFQKPSWSQCHRITGLESGRTYHYRLVFTGPDNSAVKSQGMTFTTKALANAIRIPKEDVQGPPYVLDRPGAIYVLTENITADGTAFDIRAHNVMLDLDGHKVVYGLRSEEASHGIIAKSKRGLRIVNGIVHQGPATVRRSYPVFLSGCGETEVCGLDVTYGDTDGQGILFAWAKEDNNVHHNVILDTGTTTTSRHQQINAIALPRGGTRARVHHNLILRCRQSGISINGSQQRAIEGNPEGSDFRIYNNMIYIGSCMTNSMGIAASGGVRDYEIYNNRIYGRGEMPECIYTGAGACHGKIYSNYTYSKSTGKVSTEYSATSSLSAGLRLCWGPHHIDVWDNTFISISGETNGFCGNARCVWAACSDPRQPQWRISGEINVHDNDVTALVDETDIGYARAITVCGHHEASARGLVFSNNRVASNRNCVVLSESYGCGSSDVKFVGNTFVRAGDDPRFVLLSCGFWDKPTKGSVLIDSRFEGGAGYDNVVFSGTAERNFSVGWTLALQTAPNADVSIQDNRGREVFSGKADAHGTIKAELMQYEHHPDKKIALTPHTVTVKSGGSERATTMTMDRPGSYRVDGP